MRIALELYKIRRFLYSLYECRIKCILMHFKRDAHFGSFLIQGKEKESIFIRHNGRVDLLCCVCFLFCNVPVFTGKRAARYQHRCSNNIMNLIMGLPSVCNAAWFLVFLSLNKNTYSDSRYEKILTVHTKPFFVSNEKIIYHIKKDGLGLEYRDIYYVV